VTLDEIISKSNGKRDYPIVCPFHVVRNMKGELGSEAFPSCFINLEKQVYKCFGCGEGGSFIKLKALLEGISYSEARLQLYKGEIPPFAFSEEAEKEDPIYPESQLSPYQDARGVPERGISEGASRVYGLRRSNQQDLILPYRDPSGKLRGAQIRYNTVEENTNWYDQLLWFRRGRWLFGGQLLNEQSTVILCEGALDAVKLYDCLKVITLAINGSVVTNAQILLLSQCPIRALGWWHDNDETGRRSLKQNYSRLKRIVSGEVYSPVYGEDPKDPCETSEERIVELWTKRQWTAQIIC
jgi:DNA primase